MSYDKWYLRSWFIALMFALWPLYGIPLIVGIVLLVKQSKASPAINAEAERELARLQFEKNQLMDELASLTKNRDIERAKLKQEAEKELQNIGVLLDERRAEYSALNSKIAKLKSSIISLEDEASLQEFGIYSPIYEFANSEQYKDRLVFIRQKQKDLIRNHLAAEAPEGFTLNGSKAQGRSLVNDNVKQILRSFNNECDVLISKVKFNTVDNFRKKIEKSFEQLNKMNNRMHIKISSAYLQLKLDELNLAYEYAMKKQEEKEAQREERERLREEAKLQKELEEARAAAKKEQLHYANALKALQEQLSNDPNNDELLRKVAEVESHVKDIEKNLQDIDYREANKRAGYVYIISNIGSFGEGVYKIGMTRRLEPLDRIHELGDASVPFNFDVHAMIFSDDAPALEAALHHAFENNKVNMINARREFFKVSLDEIREVVKKNFDKTVEFKSVPDAEQFRETMMLKKQMQAKLSV